MPHTRSTRLARSAACAAVLGSLVAAPAASALDPVNTAPLRRGVTVNGILAHERAFQTIANANGGTREAGTPGHEASADYVLSRLERAGYDVSEQEFEFPYYAELAAPSLARTAPTPRTYTTPAEFGAMTYSGSGDVSARVVPVDVTIPPSPAPSSTSGCEAADFAGFPAGAIALVQRGTCTFEVKAANAQAAGAAAVIIFNEGQPGRVDVLLGTLGRPFALPVVGTSFAVGEELAALAGAGEVTARVQTSTLSETRTTRNIIADTPGGDLERTVVVGAHLDSVGEGPGINDNGSGSAAILEIAEELDELDVNLRRAVRFAFWGAEELGLLGSEYYVGSLGASGVADLYANLNFDMVGSPNFVRFVYDGDNSAFPVGVGSAAGPPGSGEIERVFTEHFTAEGLASDPTEFSGRSDYGPFIAVGVPAGGLFTGAEGVKTLAQSQVYGGTAGVAYDACYHQACDTITNLNTTALGQMSDAAAHATLTLARSRTGLYGDDEGRTRSRLRALTYDGGQQLR